ncbi:MAG: TetR/AcrR family transcriptional regulator [Bdellovibrionales bacterium]|nr:TetR/AcrR family transcriptional regulator [Bdellovibrionales bacterium]
MSVESSNTKERIVSSASRLFARSGFDGTSIRDIASEAGVNIAAINYHFKHKQNLYWEIYGLAQKRIEDEMVRISQANKNVEEFVVAVFDSMNSNADMLRNTFKMILTDSIPDPDEKFEALIDNPQKIGPPGGEILFAIIDQEVGDQVAKSLKVWAVRVLFSTMIHWALMHSTGHFRKCSQNNPDLSLENTRELLRLASRSTLSFIKNQSSAKSSKRANAKRRK